MLLAMPDFLPSVVCSVLLPNRRRQGPASQAPPLDRSVTDFLCVWSFFCQENNSPSDLYMAHMFIYPKR